MSGSESAFERILKNVFPFLAISNHKLVSRLNENSRIRDDPVATFNAVHRQSGKIRPH